jgi:hypothetical protein
VRVSINYKFLSYPCVMVMVGRAPPLPRIIDSTLWPRSSVGTFTIVDVQTIFRVEIVGGPATIISVRVYSSSILSVYRRQTRLQVQIWRIRCTVVLHSIKQCHYKSITFGPHKWRYVVSHLRSSRTVTIAEFLLLTLILLTWRIWWAPNNASKWRMGFISVFKGLKIA